MICVSLTSLIRRRHFDPTDAHQRVFAAQLSTDDDQIVSGENRLIRNDRIAGVLLRLDLLDDGLSKRHDIDFARPHGQRGLG